MNVAMKGRKNTLFGCVEMKYQQRVKDDLVIRQHPL